MNSVRKGAEFERAVVNKLKDAGYIATRTPSSHTKIDVWAVHPEKKMIQFIQCKNEARPMTDKRAKRLAEEMQVKEGLYFCCVRVITPKMTDEEITGIKNETGQMAAGNPEN